MTNFGQRIVFGYTAENGEIIIDEVKSKAVEIIFEMYLKGKTKASILMNLQSEFSGIFAVPTRTLVDTILQNEVYVGNIDYPQLINQDTFNQVLLHFTANKKSTLSQKVKKVCTL